MTVKRSLTKYPFYPFDPEAEPDTNPDISTSHMSVAEEVPLMVAHTNSPVPIFIDALQYTEFVTWNLKRQGLEANKAVLEAGIVAEPLQVAPIRHPDGTFFGIYASHDPEMEFKASEGDFTKTMEGAAVVAQALIKAFRLVTTAKAGNEGLPAIFPLVFGLSRLVMAQLEFTLSAWACDDLDGPEQALIFGIINRFSNAAVAFVDFSTCGGDKEAKAVLENILKRVAPNKSGMRAFASLMSVSYYDDTNLNTHERYILASAASKMTRVEEEVARAHLLLAYLVQGLEDRGVEVPKAAPARGVVHSNLKELL